MASRIAYAALGMLIIAGCDDGGGEDPLEPRLSALQAEVLTPRCALPSCHNVTFHAGELVLEDGMSHAELVGPDPTLEQARTDGLKVVTPGDPETSFLWIKLQTGLDPSYGVLMPQGSTEGLGDRELEAVRQWILDGAEPG